MFKTNLQSAVNKYLSISEFQNKWNKDQKIGGGFYYALTYPAILSFFEEHRPLSDALSLKVALVYSWNPKICEVTQTRFEQAQCKLAALESIRNALNAKDILNVDTSEVIRKFWLPVKMATSSSNSTPGVSVTKFLHFSFPHIFPVIDLNTMKNLGGATVNRKWYSIFVSEWKDLYKRSKTSFDEIANAVNMPVARVIDIMIFTPR